MATATEFTEARLRRLADIERTHFWFVGRRALVASLVRRYWPSPPVDVLEAGCGTGSTAEGLTELGYRVVAFDMRPEGVASLKRRRSSALAFRADTTSVPLPDGHFGAAIALDVLEHVDNRQALSELVRVLKPGASIILTVPALPSLWSLRDQAAGHRRRYTKKTLEELCASTGLTVVSCGYYQCLLLPAVMVSRWLGRKRQAWRDREDQPGAFVNALLTPVARFDAWAGVRIQWPIGSSLVAVCRKR